MSSLLSALIITFIIPAIGIVIGIIKKLVYKILAIINPRFAFIIANYITFPGVIHHELSHTLCGFITGAKIKKIDLFKPNSSTLGNVQIIYRGPWLLRCIQGCMAAIGPVVVGIITCSCTVIYILPILDGVAIHILIYYLLFSVIMHMTMSTADTICFFKGSIGVYIIAVLICFFGQINLVG